jgi:hypothetical protein
MVKCKKCLPIVYPEQLWSRDLVVEEVREEIRRGEGINSVGFFFFRKWE